MDLNLTKFTNTKLKKIINVYQLEYTNGKSPGIGDFLRGSFCFMQLAQLLNIEFDIDISNHPISKYIENFISSNNGLDYNNIEFYFENNRSDPCKDNYEGVIENINTDFLNKTIDWLNLQDSKNFGFFSNAFPIFNKHFQSGRNKLKLKLMPNKFMRSYINQTLSELNLSKNGYGVIHIRTGDSYFVKKRSMSLDFINMIKNELNKLILPDRRYLIISDCNELKTHLRNIPNFYVIMKNIEHLGGEAINDIYTDGVKNTMLEFYLMSHSNAILCLSTYKHVSGFSKYCSILYNIPFKYVKIEDD